MRKPHRGRVTLAKDHVMSVKMRRGDLGDEELAPVGVGPGVRISQSPGNIEVQRWHDLIFERIAWVAPAGPERIAALHHEVGNNAMQDGSVVHGHAVLLFLSIGIGPLRRSICESGEIVYSIRRLVSEELAVEVASRSVKRC